MKAEVTDNFEVEFSSSYVRHNLQRLFNGRAIADPLTTFEVGDALFSLARRHFGRALDIFLMPDINESVNRLIFASTARWNIRDDLRAKFTIGADNRYNQQRIYQPIGFTPGEPTGSLNRFDRTFASVSLDAGVTYAWQNESGSVSLSSSAGLQGFRGRRKRNQRQRPRLCPAGGFRLRRSSNDHRWRVQPRGLQRRTLPRRNR